MHVSASQSVPSSPAAPTHPPAGVSDDTSDAVKIRIQRDAQEHKRSIEVVEFLIDHQTSFELQLPQRQQTSSVSVEKSNSQQSTQSLPQAETSEKSDRSTSNLVRRSSERTAPEHARRLRRKRQARQASEDDSSATQDVAQPNMDAELGSVPEGSSVRRAKTLPAKALAPARKQRLAAAH